MLNLNFLIRSHPARPASQKISGKCPFVWSTLLCSVPKGWVLICQATGGVYQRKRSCWPLNMSTQPQPQLLWSQMQGRMCPIRIVGVRLEAMIRKQWLVSVYDLGSHPFLRVGSLSCQFQFSFMFAWLSFCLVGQLQPNDKVFSRGNERARPYFYTNLPTSPLTFFQSLWHSVCPCILLWFPCLPFSSFILSFLSLFTHTDTRRSLPCLLSVSTALSKRLAPTYLEIINHPM